MAHKDWCGKICSYCEKPCALDQSMPCSPDCVNLSLDGEPDATLCAGCDAIHWEEICAICNTAIVLGGADNHRGAIFSCEKCGIYFCEQCFTCKHGMKDLLDMTGVDANTDTIECPSCFSDRKLAIALKDMVDNGWGVEFGNNPKGHKMKQVFEQHRQTGV